VKTWWTYEAPRAWFETLRGVLAPGVARSARAGQKIVPLEGPEAIPRIHALLDAVWSGHVGYASLSHEEFIEAFAGALAIMSKRTLGTVADASGRDLGAQPRGTRTQRWHCDDRLAATVVAMPTDQRHGLHNIHRHQIIR
jgi:hypothetical protein